MLFREYRSRNCKKPILRFFLWCGQLDRGRHRRRAGLVRRRSVVGIFAFVLEMPANAGRQQPQPKAARRGTVAGVERRSARPVARRRCAARMRRIDGPGITAEVLENPFNDRRRLDAGDDTQAAAALAAGLDVDGEHPLEALRPGHRPLPIGGRCLGTLSGSGGACLSPT